MDIFGKFSGFFRKTFGEISEETGWIYEGILGNFQENPLRNFFRYIMENSDAIFIETSGWIIGEISW